MIFVALRWQNSFFVEGNVVWLDSVASTGTVVVSFPAIPSMDVKGREGATPRKPAPPATVKTTRHRRQNRGPIRAVRVGR